MRSSDGVEVSQWRGDFFREREILHVRLLSLSCSGFATSGAHQDHIVLIQKMDSAVATTEKATIITILTLRVAPNESRLIFWFVEFDHSGACFDFRSGPLLSPLLLLA